MNNPLEPQAVSLSAVAVNPFLAFFMKYWHFVVIFVLMLVIAGMGYVGFKYHEDTTAKLALMNSQLNEYQQNMKILNENLQTISNELKIAREHRAKFDQQIADLNKQNRELRTRIRNIPTRIPTNGSSKEVQIMVDAIQKEIKERWLNVQNDSYIPITPVTIPQLEQRETPQPIPPSIAPATPTTENSNE